VSESHFAIENRPRPDTHSRRRPRTTSRRRQTRLFLKRYAHALLLLCLAFGRPASAIPPNWPSEGSGRSARPDAKADPRQIQETARQLSQAYHKRGLLANRAKATTSQFAQWAQSRPDLQVYRHPDKRVYLDRKRGVIAVELPETGKPLAAKRAGEAPAQLARRYVATQSNLFGLKDPSEELVLEATDIDALGMTHVRFVQCHGDIPIWGRQLFAHFDAAGNLRSINCFIHPTPSSSLSQKPKQSAKTAIEIAHRRLVEKDRVEAIPPQLAEILDYGEPTADLAYWQPDPTTPLELVWVVEVRPNVVDWYRFFIHAGTGENLEFYNAANSDGPVVGSGVDLGGQNRTLNVYNVGTNFFMADTTRQMFVAGQSSQEIIGPNARGVVTSWTAQNTEPGQNFNPSNISSTDANSWSDPSAVSALFNAGEVYAYFLGTHQRNSYDDKGDALFSFLHTTDRGQPMDNAFWNGKAMFYGDGNMAFTALAESFDVAAHEMSHGVIQETANLEYRFQSGALNESFADVFGIMLDRDDFQLGEDVVRPEFFPTGAMRDMANPNQGLNQGQSGWQPADMSQFQNLTIDQDNGGVHVNSGIPNHACALLIMALDRERTEQIYYRALVMYLMQQSQFIDARIALVRAAGDLFGENSAEQNAVKSAFDQVGITEGTGTPPPPDDPPVAGAEFMVLANPFDGNLWLADLNTLEANPLSDTVINFNTGRPIAVDPFGQAIVFTDSAFALRWFFFDEQSGQWIEELLNNSLDFGFSSVAISPLGGKVAFVRSVAENTIWTIDLASGQTTLYDLVHPTTVEGVSQDIVLFSDTMTWVDERFLFYDALNRPDPNDTSQDFWDVNLLDTQTGQIIRILSPPSEGVSIGNPLLASTNHNILSVEFFDPVNMTNDVLGIDLFSGQVNVIFKNGADFAFADYSVDDQMMVFRRTHFDETFQASIPDVWTIALGPDKISAAGEPELFAEGFEYPVWFAQGVPPENSISLWEIYQ